MKAKAQRLGDNRVFLRTDGDGGNFEEMLKRCKAVSGGRFVRQPEKGWTYPLSVETCLALRQVWGEALKVKEDLAEWYRAAAVERDAFLQTLEAKDAVLTRLPSLAPALAEALDPPQRVGVAAIANPYRDALLVADEPGSGKTLEIIGGVLEADLQGPILVACPRLSVRPVWHNELRKWAPDERVYMMRGTRAKRQRSLDRFLADPAPRKWLIIVGEVLRVKEEFKDENADKKTFAGYEYPGIFGVSWAATVVDESHKAFGSLTVVKGTLWGKGLKRLTTARRYAVTGTPFGKGGRLQGMFGTLHWLWSDEFTSFWRWAEQNFHVEEEEVYIKGGRGRTRPVKRIGPPKVGGEDGEGLIASLGPRILRRTKRETMPWLKDKKYFEVICEMEPAQRKQYEALLDDGEFKTAGGMVSADGVLAIITRSKQVANGVLVSTGEKVTFDPNQSCKLDRLLERAEAQGILDGTGRTKWIIGSQYNEFLYAVQARLKDVPHHLMVGSTSDAKRDKMMEDFQAPDGPLLFLLNSKAGGVSVTLDAADEMHMLDEMWDPGDNTQLEDRIHRRSRGKDRPAARIYMYRTEGTIDTNIGEDVEARRVNQHAVLDGRRGLEYLRDVVRYRAPEEEE
jgi:SNF2 family DNA or RNA helicase